jgi:putative endonuclease
MPFEARDFSVYLMSNCRRGVLYAGVTGNLPNRATQHREGSLEGFTSRYQLRRLVWYRVYGTAIDAISFEKQLKRWRREWKVRLIEEQNPNWDDLWPELMGLDVIGPLSHLQGR